MCTHVAIINHGHIVANGSLEELRAGVRARLASVEGAQTQGHEAPLHDTLTLEQIFLSVIGSTEATPHPEGELAWLS